MALLTKEQIKEAVDYKETLVEVWGGEVRVRSMSAQDRIDLEKKQVELGSSKIDMSYMVNIALACCIDEDGNKLFAEEDKAWLLQKSVDSLLKLVNACSEVNSYTKQDIEEEAKN
jgi:hypothetical protein